MIILLAASTISLTALQASINAPRDAFRTCLKEASAKASGEKVAQEGYEAYVRNACSSELGSFKGAVVKFDMGNKMSRKSSDDDADSMIADFLGSAADHYKYMSGGAAAEKQNASAAKPTTPVTPPPTPAAQPKK
jgi:hypothetical protein